MGANIKAEVEKVINNTQEEKNLKVLRELEAYLEAEVETMFDNTEEEMCLTVCWEMVHVNFKAEFDKMINKAEEEIEELEKILANTAGNKDEMIMSEAEVTGADTIMKDTEATKAETIMNNTATTEVEKIVNDTEGGTDVENGRGWTEGVKRPAALEDREAAAAGSKKKRVKKSEESYKIYINNLLQQIHPDLTITSKATCVMHSFLTVILGKISSVASRLAQSNQKTTISAREMQAAVILVVPGDLAKHAVMEGKRRVMKLKMPRV